jgi:hypothetical protein
MVQNRRANCKDDCDVAQKIAAHDQTGAFRVLGEFVNVYPEWKALLSENGPASIIFAISRLEKNSTEQTEILKRLDSILMGNGIEDGVAQKVKKHHDFYMRGKALWWAIGVIAATLVFILQKVIPLFFSK